MAFVLGDWNFSVPGESASAINHTINKHPDNTHAARTAAQDERDAAAWAPLLGGLIEHHQNEPTRLGTRTNMGRPEDDDLHITSSRLDRVYSTFPPWALLQLRSTSQVSTPVSKCVAAFISDHAPVRVTFHTHPQTPKHLRPIPKWIAKHPVFKAELTRLGRRQARRFEPRGAMAEAQDLDPRSESHCSPAMPCSASFLAGRTLPGHSASCPCTVA